MRKNILIAVVLILGVIFMAVPAFADYTETTTWENQVPHSTLMPGDYTSFGYEVVYGPGTIKVPYIEPTYDSLGCNNTVTDMSGNPIGTGYNCAPSDLNEENAEPTLIIQDMFSAVIEGNVNKAPSAQGIHQYLDSLFAFNTGDHLYIDQTLDQDLADMTLGGGSFGIWQRLHTAVDLTGFTNGHGPVTNLDPNYGTTMHLRGIDQTVEAFVSDRHPSSGSGDLGNEIISYMGQWFQAGENVTCATSGLNCSHTEFGGHGTVTATPFTPNTTQHDP